MRRPSMAQFAYIDGLYETIGVPFTKRQRPQTAGQASELIGDLKRQIDERFEKSFEEDHNG